MDRVLPSNIEIEKAVLSACILGGRNIVEKVKDKTSDGKAFYAKRHQYMYEAIVHCVANDIEPDALSLCSYLEQNKQLEDVGGAGEVASIAGDMATTSNIDHHCFIIASDYNRRVLINRGINIVDKAHDKANDIEKLYDETRSLNLPILPTDRVDNLNNVITKTSEEIDYAYNNPGQYSGLPTGIRFIDRILGGFQRDELVIIAARPSVGKTALMVGIAKHAAMQSKETPVYIVSAEMSKRMIALRMLAAEIGIPTNFLRAGEITEDQYEVIQEKKESLKSLPIYIDDHIRNPSRIISETVKAIRSKSIKAVFIDYLQLLDSPKKDTREQEVSLMSKMFKDLARDTGIPTILLAQLNRANQYRSDSRPRLSDLRDSGGLEQDADVVIFLHPLEEDINEIIVAKNRNGPTGTQRIRFDKKVGAFTDLGVKVGGEYKDS